MVDLKIKVFPSIQRSLFFQVVRIFLDGIFSQSHKNLKYQLFFRSSIYRALVYFGRSLLYLACRDHIPAYFGIDLHGPRP